MSDRPFVVIDCDQRSEEWKLARLGRLTGSVADQMLANPRKGSDESVQRRDLRIRLALERLTGQPGEEGYQSRDMARGADEEPKALAAYELLSGRLVQTCGFLSHTTLPVGCSPDGYLGEFDGLLSIKCPKSSTHLDYLRAGTFPADYEPQMLHEMLMVPSAQFYDFVSFDGRFAGEVERLQIFHIRVPRNEQAIAAYAAKVMAFLDEIDLLVASLRTMGRTAGYFAEAVA